MLDVFFAFVSFPAVDWFDASKINVKLKQKLDDKINLEENCQLLQLSIKYKKVLNLLFQYLISNSNLIAIDEEIL